MKKSCLFTSTLIAAVALSAPAWAVEGSGTADSPYYGTIQASSASNQIFSTTENNIVYVGTADTALGGSDGNNYIAGTYTFLSDIVINTGGVYLTNGNSYNEATGANLLTFAGSISGTGDWTVTGGSGGSVAHGYLFTGDLSSWSGNLSIVTNSTSHVYYGNGGTAANTNVSGTGSINVYGTVTFNYATGTVGIGNTSITALTLEFGGAADYNISSNLTGYNTTSSKLTISGTGTTTFSGEVSGFSTVISRNTISVANAGSFDISSSSVTLDSAIQNSGTVILDTNTTFVLDGLTATSGSLSSGSATYTLISGSSGTIMLGESTLDDSNVSSLGTNNVSSSDYTITGATFTVDSGTLSVTVTTSGNILDGLHGTGSVSSPYYTTGSDGYKFSFSTGNFTAAGTTVYLANDTQSFGSTTVDFYWSGSFTAACDIVIGKAGIYLTDGGSGDYYNFTGKISGEGGLTLTNVTDSSTGSAVAQHYGFTGDLSGWSGDITIATSNAYDYLIFGGTITGANSTTGNITGMTATQAATNESVSGTGAISVDYGSVEYVYTAGAGGETGETLTVTNSSIEAHQIIFTGGVNYDVSSDLRGWDNASGTSSSGSTLEISTAGTVTASGSISNFDIVTVASGSTLAIAETGSLDISGTTVTLASAIQNSGTITVDADTSFVIDGIEMGTGGGTSNDKDYYVLIDGSSGTGSISGGDNLTIDSFSGGNIDSSWSVWTDGLSSGYVVIYGEAAKDLTWDGTGGDNTWNTSSTNWSGGSTFKSGDNVTFDGTSAVTITLGEAIEAGTIDITGSGSFTISDGAGTSLKATSITVTAANGTTTIIDVSTLEVEETISIKPVNSDSTGAAHRVLVIGDGQKETTATAGALFMQGSSELQISKGSTLTVSGNLTETGGFGETISGEGTLIIEGTATHSTTKEWVISIADFQASAYAGGSGSATFSGASVTIGTMTTGSGAITFSGGASEVGTLTLSSSGASLTYSGEGTHKVGTLEANTNQTVSLDYSGLTGSLTITTVDFGSSGTLTVNGNANGTITEVSFTNNGATLAISSVVNVGTVNITTSNDMGNITIAEGATLNVSVAINVSPGGFSNGNYSTITGAGAEKSTVVTGSLNIGSGNTGAGLEVKNTTLITGGITFSQEATNGMFYLYLDDVTLGFTRDVTIAAGREGNSYIELGDKSSSSTDTTNVASTTTINTSKYVVDSTTGTGEFTTEGVSVTIAESIIGTYATLAVEGAGSLKLSGTTTLSALTLSSGSLDIAGTTSVSTGLTVSGGTLSVSEGGELALAGEVTLASAISNSGTITIAEGTSFVIDGIKMGTGGGTSNDKDYYVLIDGSSSTSSSVTLTGSVTFTIDGTEITLNGLIQRYAEGDTWNVYTQDGYLVIYGTASTTAQTASELYWAGTEENNTWDAGNSSNTIWNDADSGASGYYFTSGNNVTFGPNTDGELSTKVVLGDDITAGTVNITGSGYTLTAGAGSTLTATSIVLDDEDSATEHKFTIDTGVTVEATTLTEKAGQLDLVVNGELDVTTMTVTTTQDESISGSGKLTVGTLEYSSGHGVSLTISVTEATFESITEQASGTENSGDLRHLIFGDGTSTTTASVTSMEIKGLSEVQVAKDSTLTITELVDSSGWNTTISGDGSIKIGSMTVSGDSDNGASMLTISIANFESGAITFSGKNSLTISSANFTADSIKFTGGNEGNNSGAGGITISSGAKATIGSIESTKTHTITIDAGGELTAGEIYRSGNTLNLVVNGDLYVEKDLSGYEGSTGMISFGKSEDGGTSMAQTISGTGTANVYGIEANLGGGSLTISVTNLNIGEGGITRYGSGSGTVNINGTKVGLYNTNASKISANMTIGESGVTFNMNSGETMTISGALSGSGTIEKTGVGTLVLSAANSLTGTVTISAGTVEVTNGSALGSSTVSVSSGAKLQLDNAVSTSGTVTFSEGAKLVIGGDLLAQLATSYNETESGAVAIITASDITFGGISLSGYESISGNDTFDSFINSYVSAGDYMLTWSWSYSNDTGILSASVTSIPEPGIFSTLFGLGALGLVAMRRRRRKAA